MNIIQMQKKTIKYIGIVLQNKHEFFCFITLFFIAIFISLSFTSCATNLNSAEIIAEYMIPFVETESNWCEIKLIDEDNFGRKIYSFNSNGKYVNVFSDFVKENYNAPVLGYILCQKEEGENIFCYENSSYLYVSSFSNTESIVFDDWKLKNDWGLPLDESKMIALSKKIKENGIYDYPLYSVEKKVIDMLNNELNIDINNYYLDVIFPHDCIPVFVVREVIQWNTDNVNEKIIFGESYALTIIDNEIVECVCLTNNIYQWNELLGVQGDLRQGGGSPVSFQKHK